MSQEKQINSVLQRIMDAIKQDEAIHGDYKGRIFLSKDLLIILLSDKYLLIEEYNARALMYGHEIEIIPGKNRLYLAREI